MFANATGLGQPLAGNFFFTGPMNNSNSSGTGSGAGGAGDGGENGASGKQIMRELAVSLGLLSVVLLTHV